MTSHWQFSVSHTCEWLFFHLDSMCSEEGGKEKNLRISSSIFEHVGVLTVPAASSTKLALRDQLFFPCRSTGHSILCAGIRFWCDRFYIPSALLLLKVNRFLNWVFQVPSLARFHLTELSFSLYCSGNFEARFFFFFHLSTCSPVTVTVTFL